MGSYISIHNNTRDTYLVKVGADEAALQIAGIAMAVIGALGAIVTTAGAGAPITAALVANGIVNVMGMSTAALAAITAFAASISGVSIAVSAVGWAHSIALFITEKFIKDEGFVEVKPGETRQFGRFTLSLWRQGTCVRVRQNPSNREEVIVDTVYMRPIFSGATNNSTNVHDINFWIERFGHENKTVIRLSDESRLAIAAAAEGGGATPEADYSETDWIRVAEEAALQAQQVQLREAGIATGPSPEVVEAAALSG